MEPLLLITNDDAGGNDDAPLDRALEVLRGHADVEVAATGNPGELDGVLHRRGGRRVVVAGGDGSLHAVVAALHRRHELGDAVLGLVPLGTGNDFARGAGIPLDPVEAAEALVKAPVRPVDLIVDCAGEVVVNSVHLGMGADAGHRARAWKGRFGRAGYVLGAVGTALDPPYIRVRVELDGEVLADLDRHVAQVAIGNGVFVGGGTPLTPEADPCDGQLDVLVSFVAGTLGRLGYVARMRLGRHPEREDVAYARGSTVSVSGLGYYGSADGELFGPERNRTWHIEAGALSMLLPG